MKMKLCTRSSGKKSETKKLRREGKVPAVLYIRGKEGLDMCVEQSEVEALLREVTPGHLPTTLLELQKEDGQVLKALVKEIQYHPTTYKVLHLDLQVLDDAILVNVKVPIVCTGTADCVGVKLGGVVRTVIRHVRVRCLPKHIPASFPLDVSALQLGGVKRLGDIDMGPDIRPLADPKEVAIAIVKR